MIISSNYLGVNLLRLMGFDGIDPFVDYVNDLSRDYPVIFENTYLAEKTENGELTQSETSAEINFYKSWEYYRIFN
jgi:hypothetical protein